MTDSGEQLDLTEVSADADLPRETNLYFLTNRYNLLHILSSRLIAPVESYPKYYRDLLHLAPGHIPLLTTPPGPLLLEAVTEEGSNNFPVLIELPAGSLGHVERSSETLVLLRGAISLAAATAILVPDENALRDHVARPYENVPSDERLVAAEALFSQGDADIDGRVLSELQALELTRPSVDWQRIDAARGAAAAVLASPRVGVDPRAVQRFFDAEGWWSSLLLPERNADESGSVSNPDERLAAVALAAIDGLDRAKSWSPRRFLREVDAAFVGEDDDSVKIRSNLEAIREIVSGDREFTPFRRTASALPSAKALLLLLLRPALSGLLDWNRQETNASDEVLMAACALSGRLSGVTELPIALRSEHVDDHTAAWACSWAAGDHRPIAMALELEEHEETITMLLSKQVVQEGLPRRPTAREWWQGLSDAERANAATQIGTQLGLEPSTRIHIAPGYRTSDDDGVVVIETADPVQVETFFDPDRIETALGDLDPADAELISWIAPDEPASARPIEQSSSYERPLSGDSAAQLPDPS